MKRILYLSILIVSFASFANSSDINEYPELKPGKNTIYITQKNGQSRQVLIELPIQKSEGGYPVVFGFHGAGGKAEGYHQRLSTYVNKNAIISVSPLGTKSVTRNKNGKSKFGPTMWHSLAWHGSKTTDINLVYSIIELLQKQGLVDMKRIYATGGSSGGLLAYRLARDTDLFAAIAPTKCGMAKGQHEPLKNTSKISLLQVIGDKDKSFHGSSKQKATMYSAKERIDIWTNFNHCEDAIVKDNSESTMFHYDCSENKEVNLMILKGVGHNLSKKWKEKTDALIIEFFLRQSK